MEVVLLIAFQSHNIIFVFVLHLAYDALQHAFIHRHILELALLPQILKPTHIWYGVHCPAID